MALIDNGGASLSPRRPEPAAPIAAAKLPPRIGAEIRGAGRSQPLDDGTPAAVTGACARLLPFRFRLMLVAAAALAILLPQGKATAFEKDESVAEITAELLGSYTGDFDGMLERRRIRVLTSFSKTFYFLDRARQRGMTYELMKQFEKTLNDKYETKHRKITVVFVPVARDRLIPALIEGRGDIAAAKEIGNETVRYVSNIFKYYIAYKLYAEDLRLEEQVNN